MDIPPQDEKLVFEQLGLQSRDPEILKAFLRHGLGKRLRSSDLSDRISLSRQQIVRRLDGLVEKGVIKRSGAGPQTGYSAKETVIADAYMSTDWLRRSDKPFRIEAIRSYEPGNTRFLSAEESDRLRQWSETALAAGDTINETVSRRFLIDFAWASSRMEGNTYSLAETRELLENGVEAEGKSEFEARMIKNHEEAIDYLRQNAKDFELTPHGVREIHSLLSRGLLGNPEDEGRIRQAPVEINRSVYRPAVLPQVLEEGLALICDKAGKIDDPYEKSVFLLTQISYLQPFIDVNKRTARLMSNLPLIQSGLCPVSFYGMDDQAYIKGLIAYYEINSPSLIKAAYIDGYEQSVARFRAYRSRLSEELDAPTESRQEAVAGKGGFGPRPPR